MATRASGRPGSKVVGVLVIDDSPVFLEAVREVIASAPELELLGEAVSGEEGVAMALRVHPDLVLVDVLLPGIDGLETCRRLRSREPVPFVMLCSVEDDPRELAPELPCNGAPFLDKRTLTRASLLAAWRGEDAIATARGGAAAGE